MARSFSSPSDAPLRVAPTTGRCRSTSTRVQPLVLSVRPAIHALGPSLKLETDLLQAFHRSLAVLLLNLFGQARCIADGVNLLVGFRYDHDQQATRFVGEVAEAAVLAARHSDHVKWLQHERVLAPIAPGDLETAGEAE